MSHFATLVLVDRPITRDEAEDAVTPLLAPYDENGEWFADQSRWDWWMIGGRWTGSLSGYDPSEDPKLKDIWPTDWPDRSDDVMPLSQVRSDFVPFAVVTPDGRWQEKARTGWFGMTIPDEDGSEEKADGLWKATVQALVEQWPDAYAVIVDCHV